MDEALRAILKTALATVPVDWGATAQDVAAPRVVLYRISGGADMTMTGPTGYTQSRVQIDCYGAGVGAAKLVARQVKTALVGLRSGSFRGIFLDNERDFAPDPDGAVTLARVSLDFFVHHQEG